MAVKMFRDLNIKYGLLYGIESLGWENPSSIQKFAIPVILQNDGIIIACPDGSGKLGTGLICAAHLVDASINEVQAIVIVSTNDQVEKTTETLKVLAKSCIGCEKYIRVVTLASFLEGKEPLLRCKIVVMNKADTLLEENSPQSVAASFRTLIPAHSKFLLCTSSVTTGIDDLVYTLKWEPYWIYPTSSAAGGSSTIAQKLAFEQGGDASFVLLSHLFEKVVRKLEEKNMELQNQNDSLKADYESQASRCLVLEKQNVQNITSLLSSSSEITKAKGESENYKKELKDMQAMQQTQHDAWKTEKAAMESTIANKDKENAALKKQFKEQQEQKHDPEVASFLHTAALLLPVIHSYIIRHPNAASQPSGSLNVETQQVNTTSIRDSSPEILSSGEGSVSVAKKRKLTVPTATTIKTTTEGVQYSVFDSKLDYQSLAQGFIQKKGTKRFDCTFKGCKVQETTKQNSLRHVMGKHFPRRPCPVKGCSVTYSMSERVNIEFEAHVKSHVKNEEVTPDVPVGGVRKDH